MNPKPAPNPWTDRTPRPGRTLRLHVAAAVVGSVLLLSGCGAAEVAQQRVEQAVGAVGESAAAQAEKLLDEALSTLPGAQLEVSAENRAAFSELRTDLERLNGQVVDLLAAPQDLSAVALAPLREQLTGLQASVQQRAAEQTGISVAEQQAWADLAQSVQATADQVGFLASLLG